MKLTRRPDDRAASPVIGVILMVGTTVVLAATVYAWAGTYANVPQQAVKVVGLTPVANDDPSLRSYSVAAVMPGLRYSDVNFTLDDQVLDLTPQPGCPTPAEGHLTACGDGETMRTRDGVEAGDVLTIRAHAGQVFRVVDSAAGVVVLSMNVD